VSRSFSELGGGTAIRRPFAPPRSTVANGQAVAHQLDRLTRATPAGHPVVSCYLKLEPRDRSRGKYLIKLKNRVKSAKAALPRLVPDRAAQDAVSRDLDRIVEHLRTPANLPAAQGLAIFASEAVGLFEVLPLPLIHRSRLAVDGTPLIRELASIEDEFGRVLTVVLDRTSARFVEVTAYHAARAGASTATTTGSARKSSATSRGLPASCSRSTGGSRRTGSCSPVPEPKRERCGPSCIRT
jgi:hypothetical protein